MDLPSKSQHVSHFLNYIFSFSFMKFSHLTDWVTKWRWSIPKSTLAVFLAVIAPCAAQRALYYCCNSGDFRYISDLGCRWDWRRVQEASNWDEHFEPLGGYCFAIDYNSCWNRELRVLMINANCWCAWIKDWTRRRHFLSSVFWNFGGWSKNH